DEKTSKQLVRLAMKAQFTDHGIVLFTEDMSRIHDMEGSKVLLFDMSCTDPFLRTHSTLPYSAADSIQYSNAGMSSGELTASAVPRRMLEGKSVIAQIALEVSSGLFEEHDVLDYRISWPATSSQWSYYYLGPKNLPAPEVTHENIKFIRHEIIKYDQHYHQDRLARNLLTNFPNALLWVFTSEQNVRWKSDPYKDIALSRDDEVIISSLPNPTQEQDGKYIINALPN
ncbi:MAG: hypothetical protein AAFO69_07555, partial [Bacteroidota bacterium]